MELLAGGGGLTHLLKLLKSRVTDVTEFNDTLVRVTAGATVVDPVLVRERPGERRWHPILAAPVPRRAYGGAVHE
jgi:serine/threonine-protein kinase PknK